MKIKQGNYLHRSRLFQAKTTYVETFNSVTILFQKLAILLFLELDHIKKESDFDVLHSIIFPKVVIRREKFTSRSHICKKNV